MRILSESSISLFFCVLVLSNPIVLKRAVNSLDEAAVAEAQQRDDTATRAFSDVHIQTSDGKCLFVDKLSGDFRENLTPVQVGTCGSLDGQGWDVITAGKHIDAAKSMLIVSTTTNACFNFDDRRAAGNQVLLFSCGGRADGGGDVTPSQIFAFYGRSGPLSFQPMSAEGKCLAVKGDVLDIANCSNGDATQSFTFGGASVAGNGNGAASNTNTTTSDNGGKSGSSAVTTTSAESVGITAAAATAPSAVVTNAPTTSASLGSSSDSGSRADATANPTVAGPISRAGGTLNPTAVAESQQRDDAATRGFSSVSIRAPNGQCISVDPAAGDFRQNLIPVSLVECGGTPNEKWDVITAGKHNDSPDGASALIVSSLMQGCISFDSRRAAGDTVTMFSCGGRADGEGDTSSSQLFPFLGGDTFTMAPESDANKTCIIPGSGRLDSGPCQDEDAGLFTISQ